MYICANIILGYGFYVTPAADLILFTLDVHNAPHTSSGFEYSAFYQNYVNRIADLLQHYILGSFAIDANLLVLQVHTSLIFVGLNDSTILYEVRGSLTTKGVWDCFINNVLFPYQR